MELSFKDKATRAICENDKTAQRHLGEAVAELLKRRIADLWAATSISDLQVNAPRELPGSGGTIMTIDLCDGYRIAFSCGHVAPPRLAAGGVDWSRVARVKIISIEKAND